MAGLTLKVSFDSSDIQSRSEGAVVGGLSGSGASEGEGGEGVSEHGCALF